MSFLEIIRLDAQTQPSSARRTVTQNTEAARHKCSYRWVAAVLYALSNAQLGCGMGGVLVADHCIRLGTFLTLDDIELDFVALFQCFIAVQLDRRIMDENIRPVIAPDESVSLGVIEPLDLPFVLSHRLLPSLLLP